MAFITLVVSWIYQLSDSVKELINISNNKISAYYLANWWLEIVRNKRDQHYKQSTNTSWWNRFIDEMFLSYARSSSFIIASHQDVAIKLISVNEKNISSIDDICNNENGARICIYEKIQLSNNKEYYRTMSANKLSSNLVAIVSTIYWEEAWSLHSLSMKSKLWNLWVN